MTIQRLSLATLPAIAPELVGRRATAAGIVHLGLGNFHRAHMARYTDALIRLGEGDGWSIVGAGLLSSDARMRDALAPQDWFYTLVERSGEGERPQVIGSLAGMILSHAGAGELLAAIDAARIVSLTVTERGYLLDPATKRLDLGHPAIRADLSAPADPRSAVGLLVAAFARRRAAARPAFTAMSCDNIQHNGDVLRAAVRDFATALDPELAAWIEAHARFPNTMVDRITPVTSHADVDGFAARFGYTDLAPVFCEPFTQWVIEDSFADGRPNWDRVGAQFVADVTPYEKMKLRLLNASHLALAAIGTLIGYAHVDEAMRDPALPAYLAALMERETGPTLDPVPGVDLPAYRREVIARFANPAIRDTLARINADAPWNYILDPIRDRLAASQPIGLLALAAAARRIVDGGEAPAFAELPGAGGFAAQVDAWTRRVAEARPQTAAGWTDLLKDAVAHG